MVLNKGQCLKGWHLIRVVLNKNGAKTTIYVV